MFIKFRCPACNHKLRAEPVHAGRHATCGKCKRPVTVPESSTLNGDDKVPSDDEQPIEPSGNDNGPTAGVTDTAAKKKEDTFITFNCPGCGKRIGFPAHLPGTPARCPACKLPLMIPDRPGGESFLIGATRAAGTDVRQSSGLSRRDPEDRGTGEGSGLREAACGVPSSDSVPESRATDPAPRIPRPAPRRRLPVWAMLLIGLALLAAIALGGPRLQRLMLKAVGVNKETQPPAAPAASAPLTKELASHKEPASPREPASPVADAKQPPSPAEEPNAPHLAAASVDPLEPDFAAPDPLEPLEIRAATPPPGVGELLALHDMKPARSDDDDQEQPPKPAPFAKAQVQLTKGRASPKGLASSKEPASPKGTASPKEPAPPDAGRSLEKRLERLSTQTPEPAPPEPQCAPETPQIAVPKEPVAPTPLPCEKCMGTKFLPRLPFTPYVFLQKDVPNPAAAVPWQYCPDCQHGRDNSALLQGEAERLKTVLEAHRKLEEQTRLPLVFAETHHVTLHAQLPEATLRQVAGALEKLAGHLEEATLTTVLCQTRPGTHELVLLSDQQGWMAQRQGAGGAQGAGVAGPHLRRGDGDERHKQVAMIVQGMTAPAENTALFRMGRMFMAEASDGRAPAWLVEGFAAYCENAVTRKNLNYPMTNAADAIKPGENWDSGLRRLAGQGKLPQLEHLFSLSRHNMTPTEYAGAYSLVAFLFKTNPRDFVRYVLEVRAGVSSAAALERIYGRNAKEMQTIWARWAAGSH